MEITRNAFWKNRKLCFLMRCAYLVLPVVIFNTSAQDTHKIFGKEVNGNQFRGKREIDGKDNKRNQYFRGHCSIPGFTVDLNNHMGQSHQTAFSLPANCTGKPTWLRATWSPSIDENSASLPQGKLKGQFREGTIRTLFPLQGDFNQLTFQTTPNSSGDLSCGSELVRTCNNPTASPPNHLVLLTYNLIRR